MELDSLYKYMPHYNGSFFENFLLRATERVDLNDPFEFLPPMKFYEELVDYYKDGPDVEWAENLQYNDLAKSFFLFHGVISFSETRSNLLMWSHYANKHSGLVIEFDTNNKFFKNVKRVRYDNVKPQQLNYNDVEELFFIKSDEWIYEKEYRIVKKLTEYDFCISKFDENFTPVKESKTVWGRECIEMFMFKIPKNSIKSLTFGVNIDKEIRNKILYKIKQHSEMSNIDIWDTKLSENYFHLEFVKVENI